MAADRLLDFKQLTPNRLELDSFSERLGLMSVLFVSIDSEKNVVVKLEDEHERVVSIWSSEDIEPIISPSLTDSLWLRDMIATQTHLSEILGNRKPFNYSRLGSIDYNQAKTLVKHLQQIKDEYNIRDAYALVEKARELGLIDLDYER